MKKYAEDIIKMTVRELSARLSEGEISAAEAVTAYTRRMEEADGEIGAYLTVTPQTALKRAGEIDSRRAAGEKLPPLAGVPAGIKDNICTKGVRTTCASRMLDNFIAPYSATVVTRLEEEGCITLGKLNMDEFAMGSSNENSAYKLVKNPVNPERVPGGSSGGAAAAVAANEAAFALGSDTGGSIRQPASFCGVVGMKPTYGTVSRYGLIAFASSLDQIGPLTRTVYDSAMVMNAICGCDKLDSTSVRHSVTDFTADIGREVKGLKIALPKEFFGEGISPQVKKCVLDAAKFYESEGAEVDEISLESLKTALPAYYVISSAEASSNLARFDGIRYGYRSAEFDGIEELYKNSRSEGFGREVKRRIMLGTYVLSAGYYDAYYKKALQVRTLIMRDFEETFKRCDIILSPTAPTTAYKFGEKSDPMEMYLGDVCTVPVSIAGVPAISLPCGADSDGLPVGVQLISAAFGEPLLYRTAYALECGMKGTGAGI